MGIIALGSFLAILAAALLVLVPLAMLLSGLFAGSIGRLGFFPILIALILLSWATFNVKGLKNQVRMNQISSDCGWNEYKSGVQVDGIFIEPVGYTSLESPHIDADLTVYPNRELQLREGQIDRVLSNTLPSSYVNSTDHRTFKYGVRSQREPAAPGIIRITNSLMNFDTGEVLAQEKSYEFEDDRESQINQLLLAFIEFHPSGCGQTSRQESTARYLRVLQPSAVSAPLSPEVATGKVQQDTYTAASAQDVIPEIMQTEVYAPERSFPARKWFDYRDDFERSSKCAYMLPRFNSFVSVFAADKTETKIHAKTEPLTLICDGNFIWDYRSRKGANQNQTVIAKFAPNGDVVYKISFTNPEKFNGQDGEVPATTLQSKDGYLLFDWVNVTHSGENYMVSRRMALRIREPIAAK